MEERDYIRRGVLEVRLGLNGKFMQTWASRLHISRPPLPVLVIWLKKELALSMLALRR